ncbi:MAG: hypothetical protein D4R45_04955 [Planctomycetaceae bacterium]|nr:MAG: hypothetical protein D4R45_04955 [Planctomycetaceae bacterium]
MSDRKSNPKSLPACAVEYVQRLLKKMRYRRKVRDDIEAELKTHFEDELKDCKTSEEKEQKARQIVTDFGDLKLLAILLRRAKKRCRPLWRTVIARTFQAIGVLIVCFIFYIIWFSFGEPSIRVDYVQLLNQMNKPQVRNQDNAWPHYEKAIKLYVPQSPIVKQLISYRRGGKQRENALRLKDLLRDNQQQIQAWFEKNQKYWDNINPEQQSVVLKCFEYDWVPFPKIVHQNNNDWYATTFYRMAEHILRCLNDDAELLDPHPRGILPVQTQPGFPDNELKRWLKESKIPPNFIEAVSVAVLHEANKRFSNLPKDLRGELTDMELEYISPWIRQNEAAWKEFLAGSAKSYCYRPYTHDPNNNDKSVWSILLPPLTSLKDLTRMAAWRARIDRDQGRLQQSVEDCLAIVRTAGHWQGKGTLVEQLVGMALSGLGHAEILSLLADRKLSADQLQRLQEQLSQIYPGDYPLIKMEGERLAFMDIVQRSFTDGGPGGGHLIPGLWDELTDLNPPGLDINDKRLFMPLYTAASMAHARRDATVAKANEIYDLQSKLARMTPYQRHVSNPKTVDEIMYTSWSSYRFFLIQLFLPATGRVSDIAYRGKMGHETTKAILALQRWRLQKDQYPVALGELVSAGFLNELPMDPWSDKPLVYKKTDDNFIIYSVGFNFTDDDGKYGKDRSGNIRTWSDNGDFVFWPLPKP